MSWSKRKLKPETERILFDSGWRIMSLYQIPQRDGRRLQSCVEPSDPWRVTLHNGHTILAASRMLTGEGATADLAVLAALPEPDSLRDALARLEASMDGLIGAYRA